MIFRPQLCHAMIVMSHNVKSILSNYCAIPMSPLVIAKSLVSREGKIAVIMSRYGIITLSHYQATAVMSDHIVITMLRDT